MLVQRRDALKAEVNARTNEFEAGVGYLFLLLDASRRLLEAESEMATKQADRIKAHKSHLDAMNRIAKQVKKGFEAGRTRQADHYQAVAARLDAEIGWLRAGGKAKKPAK